MNAIRFGDMVKDFHGIGEFPVRDLLPLIPPGAKLSANSKVQPFQVGKIPGRFNRGEWSGLAGPWPTFGLAERDQQLAASWPTHNVGLRAADFPGIDCDTATKEALDMVEAIINETFGEAPARERGNAPRALFVFRRSGEAAIRKNRIVFNDDKGVEHAVEVLGLGQQYVISGIHPSGVAYEWREVADAQGRILKRDLLSAKASGLKGITVDDVNMFMSRLRSEIIGRGWTVTSAVAPKYGAGGREEGVLVSSAEPLIDNEIALEALRAIPNHEQTLPTREDLVAIVSSFKHAVGKNSEELYPDVVAWATKYGFADEPYIEKVWLSIKTARVSPDHLLNTARKYGFRGDAVLDFQDFGDDGDDGEKREMDINAKIERAQAAENDNREALSALAKKLVYWPDEQVFVVKDNGVVFSAEALNNSSYGTMVAPAGSSGVRSTANQLRNGGLLQEISGVVYLPGKSQLVTWEKDGRPGLFYNRWHAVHTALPDKVTDADVRPWLEHVEYLVPDQTERNKLLDFFAHIVQRRGQKIRWAPLLIGKQGTGKDLLIKPLMLFFGHNAQDLKPDFLTARFNGFLENELLIVQEMKRSNKTSGVYNSIKTMLSGTAADVNMVEQKYKSPYAVPNVVNMLFFSNHLDALEIDPDDRRFFVIMSDVTKREYEYYRTLADDFYKAQSGWRKVIRWLMQRDLTGFSSSEAPPSTSSKELMIEAQRGDLFLALENALTDGTWKDAKVVTADLIYHTIKKDYGFPVDAATRASIRNTASVSAELAHLGWSRYQNPVRVDGKQIRAWVRDPAMLEWPPVKIRDAFVSTQKVVSDFDA